jgi:hypothetical protein
MNFHEGGYRMRTYKPGKITDSAVSEVVGFMIIFGIMLSGIGLITLYGYPMLLQEQQNANIRNMERNMIVLQSDLNALVYKSVPYKETTMQVSGGTLRVDPGGLTSSITVANGTDIRNYPLGEILYESQDGTTTISLENGAVHTRLTSSPTGSAMLAEPRWFYDLSTQTFVMSIIRIDSSEYLTQTGIGTVRMKLTPVILAQEKFDFNNGNEVTITYTADNENNYNTAWRNYFNTLGMTYISGDDTSSQFNLNPTAKTLIVKTYTVTVLSL